MPLSISSKVHIRLARQDDGALLQRLVAQSYGPSWEWVDWSDAYPYWLIGEVDGTPEGCVMASPGRPFGRVECLCANPALPVKTRAILLRNLGFAGVACCRQQGSQAVWSNFESTDTSWQGIAQKRGWMPVGSGTFAMKRCV